MKYLLIAISLIQYVNLKAQDTSSCSCVTTYKITYPKKAEENKISGNIIIEWKVSDNGFWCDPVVIKSLGYGCDEEAMKIVKSMIDANNTCKKKCKIKKGKETS